MSLKKIVEWFTEPFYEAERSAEQFRASRAVFNTARAPEVNSKSESGLQALDRSRRIENEVLMIAEHFSKYEGVHFDVDNGDWLIIPKYPLPAKWQDRWCSLLIIFPDLYPISPPTGFYLNKKFKLMGGGQDPHLTGSAYHGAADLRELDWEWYCVTIDNDSGVAWRPSADYRRTDNLWTFLDLVRDCLTNDA